MQYTSSIYTSFESHRFFGAYDAVDFHFFSSVDPVVRFSLFSGWQSVYLDIHHFKDLMRSKNTSGYFSFYVDNMSIKTYST